MPPCDAFLVIPGISIHVSRYRGVARDHDLLAHQDEQSFGNVSRVVHHSSITGDLALYREWRGIS